MAKTSLHVLLIEDNPGDALLIREMLERASVSGFALTHVDSLAAGFERLSTGEFAVIVLDLTLVETQGIETFHRVHRHAPGVPVVVLTGANDDALSAEALQAGAQDYLVKGQVDRNMLARALRYAVERGRIEEQLRQHAAELAESVRRKDEFLAILSHELRNPLAPLMMISQMLRDPLMASADREWAQAVMERQVRVMTRLIDDLLNVSRISQGRLALRKELMDPSLAVHRAVESTRPLLQEHRHELTVSLPGEPLQVEGDSVRLEQVITNLLTNAVKYTPPGGRVSISMTEDGADAVIRVRDTGVGIPADMLDRIFDLFTRVESSPDRSSQWGSGIGLALVRGLVELHGGTVAASSPGAGGGSEFTVRLPLARPVAPAAAPQSIQPEQPMGGDRPCSVLVVDDHQDAATALARVIRSWSYEVRVASDGPAALTMAQEAAPDVVFLDIGLPQMDGYQVARKLRQAGLGDSLIVALTGYGQQEDRQRSSDAGFDLHMTKPADLDALRILLSTHARKLQQAEA